MTDGSTPPPEPPPESVPSPPPERFASGVAGLDLVLRGGFFRGGVYIIEGAPGTGKTILGNQICFQHARAGGRAVYVTLLAESHARMLANLRSMRFFDAAVIPDALYYVSGYRELESQGLSALLDLVRREMRDRKAAILVIDGLVAAEEVAPSHREFKKFLHELQILTGLVGCTTFLLTNAGAGDVHPEHTMVDGLVTLGRTVLRRRAVRHVDVPKFRGGGHLEGQHSVDISDDGIRVFPRAEAWLGVAAEDAAEADGPKLAFDIPVLDEMLGGGLAPGSTAMALGPSGIGKTTLGLHFLAAGARRREPGLLFGFYETPAALRRKAEQMGMSGALSAQGGAAVIWNRPIEQSLDALVVNLIEAVRRGQVKRLFVDGYAALADGLVHPERIGDAFAALAIELRALGVTTFYASETRQPFSPEVDLPGTRVSTAVDSFFLLRYAHVGARLHRLISLLKTRQTGHDPGERLFNVGASGVEVARTSAGAAAVLAGRVPPPDPPPPRPPAARKQARPRRRGHGSGA